MRLKQEDHKFKVTPGNLVKSCLKIKQKSGYTIAWEDERERLGRKSVPWVFLVQSMV